MRKTLPARLPFQIDVTALWLTMPMTPSPFDGSELPQQLSDPLTRPTRGHEHLQNYCVQSNLEVSRRKADINIIYIVKIVKSEFIVVLEG